MTFVEAEKVSRQLKREKLRWYCDELKKDVTVYLQPYEGTEEEDIAKKFDVYQQALSRAGRLEGELYTICPIKKKELMKDVKDDLATQDSQNKAAAEEANRKIAERQRKEDKERREQDTRNAENYKRKFVEHDMKRKAFLVARGAMMILLNAASVLLFVSGLYWTYFGSNCSQVANWLCCCVIVPTLTFEMSLLLYYRKWKKIKFEKVTELFTVRLSEL